VYAIKLDEATLQDRSMLMALAARDNADSDVLERASETVATEGSVAVFERALTDATFDMGTLGEPVPDTPELLDDDDERVLASITSLQAFAAAVNAHGAPRDPK
jgi:hypothetical protein